MAATAEHSKSAYQPAVHWLAVAVAAATFPLICLGSEVTSRHAGMSVPDWPDSYGYNMFLFPRSRWIGGIFYEHTHRLAATVVGMLSICLVIAAFWPRKDRSKNRANRILALTVLGGVLFQGILGGLRVLLVNLDLAIVHACVAQAFFCLAALAAIVSSRWWLRAPALSATPQGPGGWRVARWGIVTVAVVYAQLIIGAIMRHENAGLAIPDLPLAYGHLLPPTTAAGLAAANHARIWIYNLPDRVTLAQIWLHFGHRLGALAVTIAITSLVWLALRGRNKFRLQGVRGLATLLAGLLVLQITLGVLTVLMRKPFEIASAHVATGALVLLTTFVLTARAIRLYHPRFADSPADRQANAITARETQELAPA
ncbi:MAG TPA: COX15/CtaA family protein [Tepidisphaeraceae bacterium]|jgi:cytochrome c oxidase assembly protein subunit 15|nr:COX15/CtaA family protein [Tepidisphaeraceae bacterium]